MVDKTPQEKAKATKAKNKRTADGIAQELHAEKLRSGKLRAQLKAYKDFMKAGWRPKE